MCALVGAGDVCGGDTDGKAGSDAVEWTESRRERGQEQRRGKI